MSTLSRRHASVPLIVRTSVVSVAILALGGCNALPSGGSDRMNAVGSLTMSSPVFRPINGSQADEVIDFGTHGTVDSLWSDVSGPNIGATSALLNQTRASVSVALAGPTIDSSRSRTVTTAAGQVTGDTQTATETMKQASPDVPTPTTAPSPTDGAEAKLLSLFAASGLKPTLPPDVKASLVNNYWATMRNIQAFSNVGNLVQDASGGGVWLPYRMQFVLTADPGWWTAMRDYDAVAHVRLGIRGDENVKIVSVMPAETAQIVDDFQASLRSLAVAVALSGRYGPVAGSAEFENLSALAERLEGQRLNTNLIVGYPAANEVRVRLRPSLSAERGNRRDLQPTSRLMTATVLVRNASLVSKAAGELKGLTQAAAAKGQPAELKVSMLGSFIPGPRDRRDGSTKDELFSEDVVYSTVRPEEHWDWEAGDKPYHADYQNVIHPHPQTSRAALPAWDPPAKERAVEVRMLDGGYHLDANGRGWVTLAYDLGLPADVKKVDVGVAGLMQASGNSTVITGQGSSGVLGFAVAALAERSTGLTLGITFASNDSSGKPVRATRLLRVPVQPEPKRDRGDGPHTGAVATLKLDSVRLDLSPDGVTRPANADSETASKDDAHDSSGQAATTAPIENVGAEARSATTRPTTLP